MTQAYGPNAILTPANGLTLMRLFTTPVMLAMILERRFDHPTFWLWFVLCCTDGVDGIIARRMGSTSIAAGDLGKGCNFCGFAGDYRITMTGLYLDASVDLPM